MRGVHRERPLTRVIFDRRLRTPSCGPCLFDTVAGAGHNTDVSRGRWRTLRTRWTALRHVGATVPGIESPDVTCSASTPGLARRSMSLVLEGGPTLQAAAWQAGVVDCVHLYVAPVKLGPNGVKWLPTGTSVDAHRHARAVARAGRFTGRVCSQDLLRRSERSPVIRRLEPGSACSSRPNLLEA